MPPVNATYWLPGFEVIGKLINHAINKRAGDTAPLMRGDYWHTDHSNLETPPKATVLYAIELPNIGRNTEFINFALARDALDSANRKKIWGKCAFHA